MTPLEPPLPIRGYTLPVWVAAAARAALGVLLDEPTGPSVLLELLEPPGPQAIPVEAAALLGEGWALGQARCDPGEGLDLTRGLAVWVLLRWIEADGAAAASTRPGPDSPSGSVQCSVSDGEAGGSARATGSAIEIGRAHV